MNAKEKHFHSDVWKTYMCVCMIGPHTHQHTQTNTIKMGETLAAFLAGTG